MDMNHEVIILRKKSLNHDVIQFRLERPVEYQFVAGQAIELMLNEPVSKGPAPFTFTGLNTDAYLELTIKIYEEHRNLTAALAKLNVGDKLTITDPWDSYINKGPGVFLVGGAGITPFVALLRQMQVEGNAEESWLLRAADRAVTTRPAKHFFKGLPAFRGGSNRPFHHGRNTGVEVFNSG
jgi:ferredoxin-NADP reductase